MKTENIIIDKTFQFGLRIVKLFSHLKKNRVERDLALQLLRSGTSIGANTEEAIGGS
jgi:four helix bundle protein